MHGPMKRVMNNSNFRHADIDGPRKCSPQQSPDLYWIARRESSKRGEE
jgi:hypothetical protein